MVAAFDIKTEVILDENWALALVCDLCFRLACECCWILLHLMCRRWVARTSMPCKTCCGCSVVRNSSTLETTVIRLICILVCDSCCQWHWRRRWRQRWRRMTSYVDDVICIDASLNWQIFSSAVQFMCVAVSEAVRKKLANLVWCVHQTSVVTGNNISSTDIKAVCLCRMNTVAVH